MLNVECWMMMMMMMMMLLLLLLLLLFLKLSSMSRLLLLLWLLWLLLLLFLKLSSMSPLLLLSLLWWLLCLLLMLLMTLKIDEHSIFLKEVDLVQQYQQSIEDQTLAVPYSKTWLWQCYPYVITRGPWPIRFGDSAKKFPCFHFSTDFLGLQTSTLRFTASNITLANWC